jgi:hypothetical protein
MRRAAHGAIREGGARNVDLPQSIARLRAGTAFAKKEMDH